MVELVYKSMRNPTVNVCKGESIAKVRFQFFFCQQTYIHMYIYVKLKVWIWTIHGLSWTQYGSLLRAGNPWIVQAQVKCYMCMCGK